MGCKEKDSQFSNKVKVAMDAKNCKEENDFWKKERKVLYIIYIANNVIKKDQKIVQIIKGRENADIIFFFRNK